MNGELLKELNHLFNYQSLSTFNCDTLNIRYNSNNDDFEMRKLKKTLSNLYRYSFYIRGIKTESIEGILQGLKFQNIETQRLCFDYFGIDAYFISGITDRDWRITQTLYFQSDSMERSSLKYQEFLNELYFSAINNPLYRNALINSKRFYLYHESINNNQCKTVLTPYEYVSRLYVLRDYLVNKRSNAKLKRNFSELNDLVLSKVLK